MMIIYALEPNNLCNSHHIKPRSSYAYLALGPTFLTYYLITRWTATAVMSQYLFVIERQQGSCGHRWDSVPSNASTRHQAPTSPVETWMDGRDMFCSRRWLCREQGSISLVDGVKWCSWALGRASISIVDHKTHHGTPQEWSESRVERGNRVVELHPNMIDVLSCNDAWICWGGLRACAMLWWLGGIGRKWWSLPKKVVLLGT